MPKRTKKRRKPPSANRSTMPSVEFSIFDMPEDERHKLKAKMLCAAMRSVTEFPKKLELVKDNFRSANPLGIMTSFATYGLMKAVIGDSINHSLTSNDIQQHHGELLQAVLLTIPFGEWGKNPVLPHIMQAIFDTVPQLSDTFLHQRMLAADEMKDEHEVATLFLLERIRFQTQAVRNWGYFSDVIKLSTELYGPLDSRFKNQCGFGISDLVQIAAALVANRERRANEHFLALRGIVAGRNAQQIVQAYYRHVPDLSGTPEEFIDMMPADVTREGVISRLMTHLDYRLAADSLLRPDEISAATEKTPELVEAVLRAISLIPGRLVDAKPEHLFLNNPVWTAPGIDLGDRFFIPMPQVVFSHIHPLVARIGRTAGLEKELEDARSRFLEDKVCKVLENALPEATIKSNLKWQLDDQQFETDCVAVIDRFVVIAEAKSNHLTPAGLRGAPDRLKRHVQELIVDPSIQSMRLEDLISDAKSGDKAAGEIMVDLGIDISKVDQLIRLSVTVEDLSALHSAETEFKRLGWIPDDHELAPTIAISDLMYLTDILDEPLHFLHYLSERKFIQKEINIIGDELDFLGLYLETGFCLGSLEEAQHDLLTTGMSAQVDRYYISRDEGINIPKPQIKMRPTFKKIVTALGKRRPDGWTIAGLNLLNSSGYFEQQKIEKGLARLRRKVQKYRHDPKQVNAIVIQPLKGRKARLIFYVYSKEARVRLRPTMGRLAVEALEESGSYECCVFGRCIDNWQQPYEAVCIIQKGNRPKVRAD